MNETDLEPDSATERAYLLERTGWLVKLRSVAVAAIAVAAFASYATGFVAQPWHLVVIGAALGAGNVYWWWCLKRMGAEVSISALQWRIWQQLLGDSLALALLLHYSGGAENPFAMMFAFPAAMGAMLLPTRRAVTLGALGGAAHVTIVLGQFTRILDHHGLHGPQSQARIIDPLYLSVRFVGGYLLAFAFMLAGVIYLVRSVTERYRRAEARRRDHQRVAQSRERLARIGELSAGIAHSIRNPLHGLLTSLDLLRTRSPGDPRSAETLALMAEALGRMESVTRRLLSLTRDVPLNRVPCDLDTVVDEALELMSASSRVGRAQLVTEHGGVGAVELDAPRFTEALGNLVENALHACREGGVITVRTLAAPDADGLVAVEVADTGEGIAPEILPRVFDSFFTTKAVGEGSGLGLAMARRIVEEHGGQVTLESAPGRGTRVRLIVPRQVPALSGEGT